MKIAMIGHKRIPSREGGIEVVVEELASRMVDLGHQVTVYNRMGRHISGEKYQITSVPQKQYKGIRMITVPTLQCKSLNAILYSLLATIHALFQNYDVIHFHAEGPCLMLWLPHLFKIHTVATIHGLDWQRAKWGGFATKLLKLGEKMAARYADEIIVLSYNVQRYFKDTYGRETVYIPNGVTKPEFFRPQIIKEKYGLKERGYLLFLARIVPEKGIHYLIEAYKALETVMPLVIAGGASHTEGYFKEIKRMAEEDKRIIITGFVQGEELNELYSNAYLYVLPSDVEGMPISLLEAMSYGNCCLVSDIEENLEVVKDKAPAFRKSDVDALKSRLEFLLNTSSEVEHYRNEAGTFICKNYNWDSVIIETLNLYEAG